MKIPVYEQQLAPSQGMSVTNIPADQSGNNMATIGEGMQNLAAALIKRERVQAQMWAANATSQADLDLNQLLNDEKKAVKPGAVGFGKSYLDKFDAYLEKAVENAPNDHAKNLVRAHLQKTRESYGINAMQFEEVEGARYTGELYDKGVDMSAKLVQTTPDLFERELGKWSQTAAESGLGPDKQAALRNLAREKLAWNTATGRIDKGESVDTLKASPEWKVMTIEEQDKALKYADQKQREFKAQKTASLAIEIADQVVSKAPMLPGDLIDLPKAKSQAVAMFRKQHPNADAEQILAVESRIEQKAADRERDVKRRREASMASMFIELDKNGGDYQDIVKRYPWVENQPQEFKQRVNEYAGRVATGDTRATNWQEYSRLLNNPKELVGTNLDAKRDILGKDQFNQLLKVQQDLLNGLPEQNVVTTNAILNKLLTDAGYSKDSDERGMFESLLQQAIDTERRLTGKKELPQTRIKEIANDLLSEDPVKKSFLGISWTGSQIGFETQVPESEVSRIAGSLEAAGIEVNDYTVQDYWRREQRQKMETK